MPSKYYRPTAVRAVEKNWWEKTLSELLGREPTAPEPAPEPQTGDGIVPDILQHGAAWGLRIVPPMLGAMAGAAGGPPGVAAGGAGGGLIGELLAQKVEPGGLSRPINKGRAAVGTVLGGIPASLAVRAGKVIPSMVAGGAIGYGSTAADKLLAQEKTVEESLDPREWTGQELVLGPVFGSGVGGILGRMTGGPKPPSQPKPAPVRKLTEVEKERNTRVYENQFKSAMERKEAAAKQTKMLDEQFGHAMARRGVQFADEEAAAAANAKKLADIEAEKVERIPTEPSVRESVSAVTPEGTRTSMSRSFVKEVAEDGGDEGGKGGGTPVQLPDPQSPKTIAQTTFKTKEAALEAATSAGGKWRISNRGKGNWKATPLDAPAEPLPSLGPPGPAAQKFQSKIDELLSKVEGAQAAKAPRVVPETPAAMPVAEPPPVRPPEGPRMPPEPPSPPPVAPTPRPKKGGPKGSEGAAAVIGKGTSGLDPKIEQEVSRIVEEMETFGFTPRTGIEQLGKGSTMEWLAGSGGAPVYDDILDISGYTLDNTTRAEVTSAIRKVLAGGKPRGNKQLKLMRAAVTVGEARLKDPRSVSKPWLPPAKAAADDMMSLEDFSKAIDEAAKQPIAEAPFSLGREAAKTTPVAPELPGMPTPGQAQSSKARAAALAARKAKTTEAAPLPEAWQKLATAAKITPEGRAAAGAAAFEKAKTSPVVTDIISTLRARGVSEEEIAKMSAAPIYKSAKEAAGEGYGAVKAAKAAGEAVPEEGRAAAARAAQRLSKEARSRGLPTEVEAALRSKGVPEENIAKLRDLAETPPPTQAELTKDVREWVKGSKKRGTTLSAFGAGQMDAMVDIAKENPVFAARLLSSAAGAATGAWMSEEDPWTGALLGGIAGLAVGSALPKLAAGKEIKDIMDPAVARVPNYIRGSLLSHPLSIMYNSVAGPWGANFWGGAEQFLKGAWSKDVMQRESGKQFFKSAVNLPGWLKRFFRTYPDAVKKLHSVEEMGRAGIYVDFDNPTMVDKLMEAPAQYMLSGDLTTKGNALDAGISEELARSITLTAEPVRAIWKNMVNAIKSKSGHHSEGETSTISRVMLPFVRTAANIMESGTERTLGLGSIINYMGNKNLRISKKDQAVQQGMGTIVFGLGYAAGMALDEETIKALKIQSLISNLGGQYSLLANTGFMAGQAKRSGRTFMDSAASATARAYLTEGMPIPSTQPLYQIAAPFISTARGETPPLYNPEDPSNDWIPDVVVPGVVKAGQELQRWWDKPAAGVRTVAPRPPRTRTSQYYRPLRQRQPREPRER